MLSTMERLCRPVRVAMVMYQDVYHNCDKDGITAAYIFFKYISSA